MTALCYDTDLSDAEWAILAPLLVPTTRRGRPRKHELRAVLNAILSILRGGRTLAPAAARVSTLAERL